MLTQRQTTTVRTVALRIPDWPVVAWETDPDEPAAVFVGNRVIAANRSARAGDITVGMRRREAQSVLVDLRVLERDVSREHRCFEPIVARLDDITPRVEILRPGRCAFAARGPTRYFGGEEALVSRLEAIMAEALDGLAVCRIGVADGPFGADRAARAAVDGPLIVSPGATPHFLSSLPITVLGRPELTDVLMRLGIRSLGAFAALDPADVAGRFGADGLVAWRLSWGDDGRPLQMVDPPADLMVETVLDPPAERVDAAAFVLSGMASRFAEGLASRGLACTRVVIAAETEHGERIERCWTHDVAATSPLSATAIAQRLRWQMDGWLSARGEGGRGNRAHRVPVSERLTGGICRLVLIPENVVPATGRQLGFWGGSSEGALRMTRAMARVQGLLGDEAVTVPRRVGGRNPGDEWSLIPLGAIDLERPVTAELLPWPSQLPSPSPAVVHPPSATPIFVRVLDRHGRAVRVSSRGELSAPPSCLAMGHGPPIEVGQWAGPWPCDEKWWDPLHGRRRARLQVVSADGIAYLLVLEAGEWTQAALWD